MKCDEFLPYLETGGVGQRLLARWHAARCPRCAAVHKAWCDAKRHWARPEPMSSRQRQLWQQSVVEVSEVPRFRWAVLPMPATVAASAILCFMFFLVWAIKEIYRSVPVELVSSGVPPIETGDQKPVIDSDTSLEFASLQTRVRQLDVEIAALMPQTELLDARLQASDILNRYSKW